MIRTLAPYLAAHPFFADLDEEAVDLVAGCATNLHLDPGQYLFHEGEPAEHFYVVRGGRIALEVLRPGTGPVIVETVDEGDVVGWSWLVPPHRWFFDARAMEPTALVALHSTCLRDKCDADPALGYAILQRVTQVMLNRLQSARVRLLDLYGAPSDRHR